MASFLLHILAFQLTWLECLIMAGALPETQRSYSLEHILRSQLQSKNMKSSAFDSTFTAVCLHVCSALKVKAYNLAEKPILQESRQLQ